MHTSSGHYYKQKNDVLGSLNNLCIWSIL